MRASEPGPRRGSNPEWLRLLLLAVVGLAGGAPSVGAQTIVVRGTVIDEVSGRPLPGARATLTAGGSTLASAASDSAGRFELRASRVPVEVAIAALGAVTERRSFEEPGEFDLGVVSLSPTPFVLEAMSVTGSSACDAEPEDLAAGYRALERFRPKLQAIHDNDNMSSVHYVLDVVRSAKEVWDDGRLRFQRDTTRLRAPSALRGADPAVLAERGFAEAVSDSVNDYRGITPEWLASQPFAENYCIVAETAPGRETLFFWPKEEHRIVGVSGELRTASGEVAAVEYEYTNLKPFVELHEVPWLEELFRARGHTHVPMRPLAFNADRHGGSLVFREVSDGLWMTTEWRVDGAALGHRAYYHRGELIEVRPRTSSWERSGRLLAVVPDTTR